MAASDDAEAFGRITAQEARAVGVHWNFFPDADVNSNPANPIINTRSFGEDPKQVGDLVTAYIKGAHEGGMLTTVKHFPGHGDTATDSHLGVASVNVDRAHLDSIELPPFRQAIAAGVDSVMVAHVTVPALDPDPNHVATISTAVVTDLLEKQLGFQGSHRDRRARHGWPDASFRQRYWPGRRRGLQGRQRSADHSGRLPRFVRVHAEGGALGRDFAGTARPLRPQDPENKGRTRPEQNPHGGYHHDRNRGRQAGKHRFRPAGGELRHHPGARQRQSAAPKIEGNYQGRPSVYDQRGDAQPGGGRPFFG